MREFDAFSALPYRSPVPRLVTSARASIQNRIIASYRGVAFYDGNRDSGYGGLKYDGRWEPVAQSMAKEYGLGAQAGVLQVGADKGFLLEEFRRLGFKVRGTEVSKYAIAGAPEGVQPYIELAKPTCLPFDDGEFDLVIAAGPVYSLTLEDAIRCLKEIKRVGRQSFITLGAYDSWASYFLFRGWSLLGCTILSKADWLAVLEHCEYTGDYKFNTAESLGLQWS